MPAAAVNVAADYIAAVDSVGSGTAGPGHIEGGVGDAVITEAVRATTVGVLPDDIAAVDTVGVAGECPGHIASGVGGSVITEAVRDVRATGGVLPDDIAAVDTLGPGCVGPGHIDWGEGVRTLRRHTQAQREKTGNTTDRKGLHRVPSQTV